MADYGLPHLRTKLDNLATQISGTEDFEKGLIDTLYGIFLELERLSKLSYEE